MHTKSTTKRRWSRKQILQQLTLIGDLESPLPPTLPTSPTISRASSPAPTPTAKRKLDDASDLEPAKRPRTSTQPRQPPTQPTPAIKPVEKQEQQDQPRPPSIPAPPLPPPARPNATATATVRSEPCEDGEVPEEAPFIPTAPSELFDRPIRRPKKGRPSDARIQDLVARHHAAGRALKYSGQARIFSSYPPSSQCHRPLSDPPPPNSLYHKHSSIISRLEIIDALLNFTYAKWLDNYKTGIVNYGQWKSVDGYIDWCVIQYPITDATCEEERILHGLICMVQGFVKSRCAYANVKYSVKPPIDVAFENLSRNIAAAAIAAADPSPPVANGKAPPMLPSPASTNSTPVTHSDGTPSTDPSIQRPTPPVAQAAPHPLQYRGSVPTQQLPANYRENPAAIPAHVLEKMEAISEPVSSTLVQEMKHLTENYVASVAALETAYSICNLPAVRRCYPKTWARMIYSTLGPKDEIEPDMDDDEGELCWPEQTMSGSGIAWVCLMGKAMVIEYGKRFGYKSAEGVVRKPLGMPEDAPSMEIDQRWRQQPSSGSGSGSTHSGPPPPPLQPPSDRHPHPPPPPGYASSNRDSGHPPYGHHQRNPSSGNHYGGMHGPGSSHGYRPYPPHGPGGAGGNGNGHHNNNGNHHGYGGGYGPGHGHGHRPNYSSSSYNGQPPR